VYSKAKLILSLNLRLPWDSPVSKMVDIETWEQSESAPKITFIPRGTTFLRRADVADIDDALDDWGQRFG
jgi:hypothetical protein